MDDDEDVSRVDDVGLLEEIDKLEKKIAYLDEQLDELIEMKKD